MIGVPRGMMNYPCPFFSADPILGDMVRCARPEGHAGDHSVHKIAGDRPSPRDYAKDMEVFNSMPDTATRVEIQAAIEADRAKRSLR